MTTAVRAPKPSLPPVDGIGQAAPDAEEFGLRNRIDEILSRRPAVGLAVGVVRDGRPTFIQGHGGGNARRWLGPALGLLAAAGVVAARRRGPGEGQSA